MAKASCKAAVFRIFSALLGCAAQLLVTPAWAWGDDGHRAIGELAFRALTPGARAWVTEALSDPGYESLAEAANWPDSYARRFHEYDAMKPFHYVDVLASAPRYRRDRDCPRGCVVTALTQFIDLLGQPASLAERRRLIYWVSHLMGDIHQPLHIAHPDNKGGTATRIPFFDEPEKRSAHWIWDIGLIERRPVRALPRPGATQRPAYVVLADELEEALEPRERRLWSAVTAPEAIANEGLVLARRYAFLMPSDRVELAYETSHWPIVEQQLQKAAVRLAVVLERSFRNNHPE